MSDWRSTCSIGWPMPRSVPSDIIASSSASRTRVALAGAATVRLYGAPGEGGPTPVG